MRRLCKATDTAIRPSSSTLLWSSQLLSNEVLLAALEFLCFSVLFLFASILRSDCISFRFLRSSSASVGREHAFISTEPMDPEAAAEENTSESLCRIVIPETDDARMSPFLHGSTPKQPPRESPRLSSISSGSPPGNSSFPWISAWKCCKRSLEYSFMGSVMISLVFISSPITKQW